MQSTIEGEDELRLKISLWYSHSSEVSTSTAVSAHPGTKKPCQTESTAETSD